MNDEERFCMKKLVLILIVYQNIIIASETVDAQHNKQPAWAVRQDSCGQMCRLAVACFCFSLLCPGVGNDMLCSCGYPPQIPSWYNSLPSSCINQIRKMK